MHRRLLLFALALPALALPTPAQVDSGSWSSKGLMPRNRNELAGALLGDRIYAVGGLSGGGVRDVFVFDPARGDWTEGPSLPVGLHHLHLGAQGGKLYVLGGCAHARNNSTPPDAPWVGSRHAFALDPADGQWRRLKPLPHSAGMGGVAAFGGRLYVIGGVDTNGVTLDLVQEYNPVDSAWRQRARMPTPREHIGVAVLDSLIYVAAGRQKGLGGVSVTAFEAYSPASDTWYRLPPVPTARSGLALAASRGRIYALGGEWPGVQTTNEEYDPAARKWRRVKAMPIARHGFAAVTYRDTVYAFGYVQATHAFLPPAAPGTWIAPRDGAGMAARAGTAEELRVYSADGRRRSGQGRRALEPLISLPSGR